jgi:sRNA-binding carbon storage regulator CsrA
MAAILLLLSPLIMTTTASDDYGEQIFERNLDVGDGVEIEHSIKIEVVDTAEDIVDSAEFCISSPQVFPRTVKVFAGDTPTNYETYNGARIYLEVISVHGETVLLMVTGPKDWRVTRYYETEDAKTESKPATETVAVPELEITRTLDRNYVEQGGTVEVTFKIKNMGNGTASEIELDEPLLRGAYQENCPPTLDDIAAGATERVSYDLKIVDTPPGTYELCATLLNYEGKSGAAYSSESSSNTLEVTAKEVQVPTLEIGITIESDDDVMICGDRFLATIGVINTGNATSGRVTIKSHLPDDVRVADGEIDPVYESIKPGDYEEYEVMLIAYEPGKHVIKMDAMWADEEASASAEFWAERSSLATYYPHILAAVPIGLLLIGIIRRHREYSY